MTTSAWFRLLGLPLLALASAYVVPAWSQAPKGKKYALLVGVTDYESSKFTSLKYTENDVVELAKLLTGAAGGFDDVRVLTNSAGAKNKSLAPTAANIRASLEEITAKRNKHDTVLIALSGHGVHLDVHDPEEKGQPKTYGFFCPVDADLRGVSYSTGKSRSLVNVKEVFDALDECGASTKLVFMDACRNEMKAESATRSLDVRKFTIPEGVGALFSCRAGQKAYETEKHKHGVFFHYLLEGLRGKAANARKEVTYDLLVSYVKEKVSEEVPDLIGEGARQEPHAVGSLSGKSPVLARLSDYTVELPGKEIVKAKPVKLKVLDQADDKTRSLDVIYWPAPQKAVEKMLEVAKVTKDDVVYDLGCGDGRIVVTAAKMYGCRAIGFDLDPERVKDTRANIGRNRLEALAFVRQRDILKLDLSEATVVTLYLLPSLNVKLIPQLKKLKPGSRIISHDFDMDGVTPDKGYPIKVKAQRDNGDETESTIYRWTTPLKLEKE